MVTPNLFVAAKYAAQPHKWFRSPEVRTRAKITERRDEPVPGIYEHFEGRGWYLIAADGPDQNDSKREVAEPQKVVYSKSLHRWFFEREYRDRSRLGFLPSVSPFASSTVLPSTSSTRKEGVEVGFFLLDDGLTWINNFDHEGYFIPGPYQRFVVDKETPFETHFREMTLGDSRHGTPSQSRAPSQRPSRNSSRTPSSRTTSTAVSRCRSPGRTKRHVIVKHDDSEDRTAAEQRTATPRGRLADAERPSSFVHPGCSTSSDRKRRDSV